VKIAATLDGRTALANGASRWITGPAARADVHRWRARSGAILTGSGTVLADDPRLDARREEAGIAAEIGIKQPLRAIVDSQLRTPRSAKTLAAEGAVLFTTDAADAGTVHRFEAAGARVERVTGGAHCDLGAVLARLAALEVNDVLVEAGPGLNGALLAAGLIDELIVYLAPKLFGAGARAMFAVPDLREIAQGWTVTFDEVRDIGDDLRIVGRPSRVAGA
jgi:diaminohydroxyphosphoribosylaminopyrimidine deaminase/5-amino-6-(5-phosphoribosylamino)uracil reductase